MLREVVVRSLPFSVEEEGGDLLKVQFKEELETQCIREGLKPCCEEQ